LLESIGTSFSIVRERLAFLFFSSSNNDVLVLDSEPRLELSESLLVGGEKDPDEPLLLRDYLRLFTKLVPRNVVDPFIVPLVNDAIDQLLDDPDRAQADLETLTSLYSHREAFRALLKVFGLRRAENKEILHTAARYWEVTRETEDPLLLQIVKDHFLVLESPEEDPEALKFVEDMWRLSGGNDTQILLKLAVAYEDANNEGRMVAIIEEFLGRSAPTLELAVVYTRSLTALGRPSDALEFINRFKAEFSKDVAFFSAWADVLLRTNDLVGVEALLSEDVPGLQGLKTNSPAVYAGLLRLVRRTTELDSFLTQNLQSALRRGPSAELQRLGELFDRFGRWEEFEASIRSAMSERAATEFLSDVRRQPPRVGLRRR